MVGELTYTKFEENFPSHFQDTSNQSLFSVFFPLHLFTHFVKTVIIHKHVIIQLNLNVIMQFFVKRHQAQVRIGKESKL